MSALQPGPPGPAEWQEIFAEAQVQYASAKIMGCTKFFTMRAASR